MKKTSLILSLAVVMAATLTSCQNTANTAGQSEQSTEAVAQKGAIVYFDLDRVLQEYDMANDLSSVVQTKAQSIEQELNRKGNKLQNDVNAFQQKIDKGLLTRSVAEAQSSKLQQQQNEFQNYYAQKQQEMQEEQSVAMNQIADAIKAFLDKFNEEKQYALIIANQGAILPSPVATGDASLDITDEILEGLNAEYVKTKNNSSSEK
jgi:outer membrane protein